MNRLIKRLTEQIQMNAYANVMSGRRVKWYSFGWIRPLLTRMALANLIVITFMFQIFYYLIVPLLIVCMFLSIGKMKNQLDTIEANVNSQTQTTD